MAEIKVNSTVLRDASTQIKNQGTNFQSVADAFEQGLNSLSSTWQGEAFDQFKAKLDSLAPSLDSYYEVIQEYATFLDTTAEKYEEAENQASAETEELVNDLFKGW